MVKFLSRPFLYQNKTTSRIRHIAVLLVFLLAFPAYSYASEISNSEVKASWIFTLIDWLNWKDPSKNEKPIICEPLS